eukprot:12937538-Prorocentrum_lima.AAC.1
MPSPVNKCTTRRGYAPVDRLSATAASAALQSTVSKAKVKVSSSFFCLEHLGAGDDPAESSTKMART